ncbi:hypothetical protein HRbin34_00175 [bacterium HR34]|nr:hypothetical protein HRbin34_00175 [bacterium HR34]
MNYYNKPSKFPLIVGVVIIFLSLSFTFFIIYSIFKKEAREQKIKDQVVELQRKIEELESKKKSFENIEASLGNNYFFEKEVRLKLNLKKPGEKVITILREENNKKEEEKKTPWWQIFNK